MTDTVPENDRRTRHIATAAQTEFTWDFPGVETADDLRVYVEGVSTEDFTIDADTLTVTLDTGASDGDIVVIEGQLAIKRPNEYPRSGNLQTRTLNPEFNDLFRMLQELRRDLDRALTLNKAESASISGVMPLIEANKALVGNADGDGFSFSAFSDLLSDINTVLTGLATDDFLAFNGTNWVNKTPAQVRTLLGLQALALKATIDNAALIASNVVLLNKLEQIGTGNVLGYLGGGTGNVDVISVKDEDNMVSNSAVALCTQQSIKAYVDTQSAAGNSALQPGEEGRVYLTTITTLAGDTSIDIEGVISATYDDYEIVFHSLAPQTDAVKLQARTSTDNGATYDSGASDYGWSFRSCGTTVSADNIDDSDSEIELTQNSGNAAGRVTSGSLLLLGVNNTAVRKALVATFSTINSSGNPVAYMGGGWRYDTANNIDAVRLFWSSGNFAAGGVVKVYGLKK